MDKQHLTSPVFIKKEEAVTNWFASVLVGSILWTIIFGIAYGAEPSGVATCTVISFFVSAALGLPGLFLLWALVHALNKRKLTFRQYIVRHYAFHALIAFLTFGLICIFDETEGDAMVFGFVIAFTYTIVGMLGWLYTFYKYTKPRTIVDHPGVEADQKYVEKPN